MLYSKKSARLNESIGTSAWQNSVTILRMNGQEQVAVGVRGGIMHAYTAV